MKKILSIIAVIGLTATTSTTVVACNAKKDDNKHNSIKEENYYIAYINFEDPIADVTFNEETMTVLTEQYTNLEIKPDCETSLSIAEANIDKNNKLNVTKLKSEGDAIYNLFGYDLDKNKVQLAQFEISINLQVDFSQFKKNDLFFVENKTESEVKNELSEFLYGFFYIKLNIDYKLSFESENNKITKVTINATQNSNKTKNYKEIIAVSYEHSKLLEQIVEGWSLIEDESHPTLEEKELIKELKIAESVSNNESSTSKDFINACNNLKEAIENINKYYDNKY